IQVYNLCAGYPKGGISTCQGDSGGPLVCRDKHADFFWQVGITSWAVGCARPKLPSVFSSTQYFYNWILTKLGQSAAPVATITPAPAYTSTPVQPCPFPRE
ncbi:ACRO protein, partial [Calyptomena viridis]|nr:ACRO protein [Calyptomena viridis]